METRIDYKGYELLKSRYCRSGSAIYLHILIAESFFKGQLPKGNEVHHLDGDKANNEPSNLMVCSPKQHRITHRIMRAKKACGNGDWRKCVYCGQYDDPKNMYISRCNRAIHHRDCQQKYIKEKKEK